MKRKITIIMLALTLTLTITLLTAFLPSCYDNGMQTEVPAPQSVTVTLELNGGSGVTQLTLIGEAGSPMVLPTPVREGYTFDRWYSGWHTISQTEFPIRDTVLTARYFANEDSSITISSIPTALNENFSSDTTIIWDNRHFSRENWQRIEWLRRNHTTEIALSIEFEARSIGMSLSRSITFTGANAPDVIGTITNIPGGSFEEMSINGNAQGRILVANNDTALRLVLRDTSAVSQVVVRNIKITITYIQQAGLLV
ncbi:MAG: InlB B-repeat-containing protein [Firmicutes bacterium]|nr:InlB B-repeat-containing protein [Bacillota bacterium]